MKWLAESFALCPKRQAYMVISTTTRIPRLCRLWWGKADIRLVQGVQNIDVNLVDSNPRDWWVDTGATKHVCSDREAFNTFEPVQDEQKLFMRNLTTSAIAGKGSVIHKMTSSKELTLKNVMHVLDMRKNLVSGTLLNKHGFRLVLESDKFTLTKSGMYVGK